MTTKNTHFIQIYRNSIDVFRVVSHNPTAIDILALVMKYMDNQNNVITTIKQLCKYTKKSKPSVYAAIKLLKDKRIIHVTNTGGTCVFVCNPRLAWTSYAGSRDKFAKIHAVLLIDETEFPEYELTAGKPVKRGAICDLETGEL